MSKCHVRNGRFVEPCKNLASATEHGNPRGKQKGIYAWAFHNGREPSRTFWAVKSGEHTEKGFAFNFCPFCGESIDAPTFRRADDAMRAAEGEKG